MIAAWGCFASGCPCRPPVPGEKLQILYVEIGLVRIMIDFSTYREDAMKCVYDGMVRQVLTMGTNLFLHYVTEDCI